MRNPVPARLTIADVALFYGERSGGIRTYLDAKVSYARSSGAFDHHLLVPGPRERHTGGYHELRSLRVAASNGYRVPLGARSLAKTLKEIRPHVVLLHDPFWQPLGVVRTAHQTGAAVVAVHHASSRLSSAGIPGPNKLYVPLLRAWLRQAYREVDHIMAAVDTRQDCGRSRSLALRFGLDPAFRPQRPDRVGSHVVYAGRFGREKGIFCLLEAAARAREAYPLVLIGDGPAAGAIKSRAAQLGLSERISFRSYISDRHELAREYRRASCVVMPGAYETFGLVGLEAAASGASVVACSTAPSCQLAPRHFETFKAHDPTDLAGAIARARASDRDPEAAREVATRFDWDEAFACELNDLRRALTRRAGDPAH